MGDETITCPKCGSNLIHVDKRGFSAGKAIAGGLLTGNLLVAAAAGGIGKNKIELTCLKCGHKFKIGEENATSGYTTHKTSDYTTHKSPNITDANIKFEKQKTVKYRCDCGKEAWLPTDSPICPVCGRRLTEGKKIQSDQNGRKGCFLTILFPIVIVALTQLL